MKATLHLTFAAFALAALNLSAATLCLSPQSLNPLPPYTNWTSAAHAIQDAVDAASAGDEIVVTNGAYAAGGRPVGTNLLLHHTGRSGLYSAHGGRTQRLPGLLHLDSVGYLTRGEERPDQFTLAADRHA